MALLTGLTGLCYAIVRLMFAPDVFWMLRAGAWCPDTGRQPIDLSVSVSRIANTLSFLVATFRGHSLFAHRFSARQRHSLSYSRVWNASFGILLNYCVLVPLMLFVQPAPLREMVDS